MKTKLITAILTLSGLCVFAQPAADLSETRPKNDVSINFFGDASIFSLSYERVLLHSSNYFLAGIFSPNFFLAGKLGVGYGVEGISLGCFSPPCLESPPEKKYITLPHHLTANIGNGKKFFEFGVGGTFFNGGYLSYATVGFRVHPLVSEGLSFRIFLQRRFLREPSPLDFLPLGLSFGFAF